MDAAGSFFFTIARVILFRMKITVKATRLILTPALKEYIEKKISPLSRFLARFEAKGESTAFVEIARTTRHHKNGEVYAAEIDLDLGSRMLRVEQSHRDVRAAIDLAKDALREKLAQYKKKVVGR